MQKSFVLMLVALFFVQLGLFVQDSLQTEVQAPMVLPNDDGYSYSDRNLKKNISEITDPIKKLNQLNGYYYQWKQDDDQSTQVGVIAQEVKEALPELVKSGPNGMTVDYEKIVALLIEVNQAQQQTLDILQQDLADHQYRMKNLEAKVRELGK